MNTNNKNIERAHRVGEESNNKKGAIEVQFSFYKYKKSILINLRELTFPYSKIFHKGKCKFVRKNRRGY